MNSTVDARETQPTHAGGIVYRRDSAGQPLVLLVRASRAPHEWVLPKGHIEIGETAEQTARREILEEAGVDAMVERRLGEAHFVSSRGQHVQVLFFLMAYCGSVRAKEIREVRWCSTERAEALSLLENVRILLRSAARILSDGDHR